MIYNVLKRTVRLMRFTQIREALRHIKTVNSLAFSPHAFAILTQLRTHKPEIVYVHEFSGLLTLYKALKIDNFRILTDLKIIYDAHELEMYRNPPKPYLIRIAISFIEGRVVKALDCKVVTVSENIAALLERRFKRKIFLIKNHPTQNIVWEGDAFHNLEISAYTRRSLRDHIAFNGGDKNLPLGVIIGKLTVNRGIEETMYAMSNATPFNLVLVGPFNDKMYGYFSNLIAKLGLVKRVFIVAPLPNHQVVRYIQDADFSILPIIPLALSYYFCAPNKLYESFAAKLPIIYNGSSQHVYLRDVKKEVDKLGVGIPVDFLSDFSGEQLTNAINCVMRGEIEYPERYQPMYFDDQENHETYRKLIE